MKQEAKRYTNDIEHLQHERALLTEHVDQLNELVQNREDDLRIIEAELEKYTKQIEFLQNTITQQGKERKTAKLFTGKKGDMLDELLGNYINETGCPVPIKRLGNGYYMFGARKIFAKVLNGRLVIRVGGGYMVIEEFISAHAETEMRKKRHMDEKAEREQAEKLAADGGSPRGSKVGKSITAVADTRLAGTARTKRYTESQLKTLKERGGVRVLN